MLRPWTRPAAQTLSRTCEASTSKSGSSSATFHTSAIRTWNAEAQKRTASHARRKNIARRIELDREAAELRPHPVLGTHKGNEVLWQDSDLARVLLTPDTLDAAHESLAPVKLTPGRPLMEAENHFELPRYFAHGITESEREMLFDTLLTESAKVDLINKPPEYLGTEQADKEMRRALNTEGFKASMLARVLDLRNANARGIAFENRRRVVEAFSEPGKPNDTGRAEVQIALLTMQIHNVWEHMMEHKRDVAQRRAIRGLIHKRAKMLKYLKRLDRQRYDICLERVGVESAAVEGEITV